MFVILCASVFTFFSLLVSAAGDFRMQAKTIEDPKAVVIMGIVIFGCSIPVAWFIRFSAVVGSWTAFERIEGVYKRGLKREAWQMLMSRYRIHRVVIQSQRFRQFLCDMCDYVISVDALNDNQKTLLRNLLAAAGDPSIRGIGMPTETSTSKWGKWIVLLAVIVILARILVALVELLARGWP